MGESKGPKTPGVGVPGVPGGGLPNPLGVGGGLIPTAGGGGGILGQLFGPGGGLLGGPMGKTDPWYLFHEKKKVNYDPVDVEGTYNAQGGYQSIRDPNGNLQSQYKIGDAGKLSSQLDATGINALKGNVLDANGKMIAGPSAWGKLAEQSQRQDEMFQRGDITRQGAGQLANARSSLAMRGGLRGGAAERLAAGGAESQLMAAQDLGRAGMQTRAGIGMQDEGMKQQQLQSLIGAQQSQAGYLSGLDQQNIANKLGVDQFNMQNAIADLSGKNAYTKDLVGQKIAAKGAAQTASATENAGKK